MSYQFWQSNALISHGSCSVLGVDVPSPYFLQELLIGAVNDPTDKDYAAAVARVFVGLEVSERDEAFVQTICGENFDWWNSMGGTYPTYDDFSHRIAEKVYEVSTLSILCPKVTVSLARFGQRSLKQQKAGPLLLWLPSSWIYWSL